uniref:Uncharacterized protein n=1 Tax=Ciona intestinalis TaxID=7719 RepID=H2XRX6_CIOIN
MPIAIVLNYKPFLADLFNFLQYFDFVNIFFLTAILFTYHCSVIQ